MTLAEFAIRANSFVKDFFTAISESTPHIYISAMPFLPATSVISEQYMSENPQLFSVDREGAVEGHSDEVNSVAFLSDGEQIVSGSDDNTVCLWRADTGERMGYFEGHQKAVNSIAFAPVKGFIAAGSDDYKVNIWYKEKDPFVSLEGPSMVNSVAFSPDGEYLVSGSSDAIIRVWHLATSDLIGDPLRGHQGSVLSVAFSPDGKRIVSGSEDKTLRVWHIDICEVVASHKALKRQAAGGNKFDAFLAESMETEDDAGADDEQAKVTSNPFEEHTDEVNCVAFSSNEGKWIASGSDDCTIKLWDAETGQSNGTHEGHTDVVNSVAFSPNDKYIVSGSSDNTLRIWSTESGLQVSGPFYGHTDWVWSVAFSPDGSRIVSGSIDHTVQVWQASTDEVVAWHIERHFGTLFLFS